MPSQQDIQPAFDPTNYTSLNGAQILQLLTSASPYTDKGMVLVTTDVNGNPTVPDARNTGTPKWQNYIWLRLTATSVFLYLWNPAGATDATLLQWTNLTVNIGAGSITNAMIQDNTIQDGKIANLSYSKLIGAPVNLPPSGNAGGSLTGTYPSPTIANNAITNAMIAAATITGASIAANTITVSNLLGNNVANNKVRTNSATPTNVEWYQGGDIDNATVVSTGNPLAIPQVNAGANGWQMKTISQLLSQIRFTSTAVALSAGSLIINQAHGLGGTPSNVRSVMIMGASTELGFTQGDEIDLSTVVAVSSSSGNDLDVPAFQFGANATNVFCSQIAATGADGSFTLKALHKTTGAPTSITQANWTVKIYATL